MNKDKVTDTLANYVAGLRYATIPPATLERAKDLLLDYLGVALAGSKLPWSRIVHARILSESGKHESTLLGGGKAPARAAALVNGTAGHANELDDTHDEGLNHPGCVVMPAALAVAEALRKNGRDVLTSIVAGYEAQCRIAAASGAHLMCRGVHPTAACGVFGSSAAAASLLELNAEALANAWGSAACGTGLMRFAEDSAHPTIKRMHGGLPAERGVLAAQLTAEGFLGPRDVIGGARGFADALAGNPPLERILLNIGTRFELDAVSVKLYPCCKMFHSLIEAITKCKQESLFAPDDVESVLVYGHHAMIDSHMEYQPKSEMSAQYSLPHTAAVAILLDPGNPDSFGAEAIVRDDVRRMTNKVTAVEDPQLQAMFPRRFPGGVCIALRDGRQLKAQVIDSESSPAHTLSRERVRVKFESLTQDILSPHSRESIACMVEDLDKCSDIGKLMALFHSCPPAA